LIPFRNAKTYIPSGTPSGAAVQIAQGVIEQNELASFGKDHLG